MTIGRRAIGARLFLKGSDIRTGMALRRGGQAELAGYLGLRARHCGGATAFTHFIAVFPVGFPSCRGLCKRRKSFGGKAQEKDLVPLMKLVAVDRLGYSPGAVGKKVGLPMVRWGP
jgi:hypothetical protein